MPAVTSTEPTHNSQFMMNYPADDILLYPFKNTKRYISRDEGGYRDEKYHNHTKTQIGMYPGTNMHHQQEQRGTHLEV